MGFISGIAFIALIIVYGYWLYNKIRELVPVIKRKINQIKTKKELKQKERETEQ